VDGHRTPGRHQVTFDGQDLPTSEYLIRLSSGSYRQMKKMLLLR